MTDERRPAGAARTTRARTIPDRADILARLIHVSEALEDGDVGMARAIVLDLLDELRPVRPSGSCPECGLRMWPGEVARHVSVVHGVDPFARAA